MVGPTENKVFIPPTNNPRPPVPQSGFINFPHQFPNNNNLRPPMFNNNNTFQQQHMFSQNNPMMMMNPTTTTLYNPQQQHQQMLLQNTIQNISQLLHLQNNPNPPIQFPNPNPNPNQFGVMQHAPVANPFFQNQIIPPHGVAPLPQNPNNNFYMPQMFNPMMQNVNNNNFGQPRFVSPVMDVNAIASTQMVQTQNPAPTVTNLKDKNVTSVSGGWANSQHKNFSNDASHKRFKPHKHVKEKFGIHNGNMNKGKAKTNSIANSGPGDSTKFEMKLPSLKYSEQEIKQWREARKKHYPKSTTVEKEETKEQTLSDVTNKAATLRRQQLKEVLAKQAELGLEVADIPSSYLSSPSHAPAHDKQNHREKKERYKKGKFQKRRGKRLPDDRNAKRTRKDHEQKPNEKEPSLLQKLLTRDIKREKNHLLQVFRFIAANSFFNGEETDNSLRFPSVIVRETNPPETISSVSKVSDDKPGEEDEEGEITD